MVDFMKYEIKYIYKISPGFYGVNNYKSFKDLKNKEKAPNDFKLLITCKGLDDPRKLFFEIKNGLIIYGNFVEPESEKEIYKYSYSGYIINLALYKELSALKTYLARFASVNNQFKHINKIFNYKENDYIVFSDDIGNIFTRKILKYTPDNTCIVNFNNKKTKVNY